MQQGSDFQGEPAFRVQLGPDARTAMKAVTLSLRKMKRRWRRRREEEEEKGGGGEEWDREDEERKDGSQPASH